MPAVLARLMLERLTGVVTLLLQRASAGQVGSPPPLTLAVLMTLAAAAAVGVTGMTKVVVALAARPAAIVHVTTWPAAVQPAGKVPMVRPVGMVSVIVDTAVVTDPPVFCTASV